MKKKVKIKAKPREKAKEPFFVGIGDPVIIRRNLLLSSKSIIDSLKRQEGIVDLRLRKENYLVEFKRVMDEIIILNKKLRSHLPKVPLREKEVRHVIPARALSEGPEAPGIPRKSSHIELLEKELARIESKLDALDE
jgi:hypothetical protein